MSRLRDEQKGLQESYKENMGWFQKGGAINSLKCVK